MSSNDMIALAEYLRHTLSPDVSVRKPAEKFMESLESKEGYALLLLQLVNSKDDATDLTTRIAASIAFKNFIKRKWVINEDIGNCISENDRNAIKNLIVNMMLQSPEQIQRQLSDSVSIIGREDFPEKWPKLLDDMINHIEKSGADFGIINGVLQTAHSLFKRYRHEFKSNTLWTEIKYVLDRFAKPFTDLFVWTVDLAKTHANNSQALKIIFSSLILCTKIFNSLNAQDLPEFFEDNISIWMKHFLELLTVDNKLLQTDEDEEGLLEQLKSQICDNIVMYAQKYNEEFQSYLPNFVETVWTLLINTGPQPKYDLLVSNAIRFLSSVAERSQYENLFQADNVLDSISSKIIIPNMEFRVSDEELFEDNPEEYIRRDIEGSDIDTRRRAACELVKALSRHFEMRIITIFGQYIQSMLTKFQQNPKENWKSKDAAIYLVTSMAVKGSTVRYGTTSTSELVNVVDFYKNFIRADLEKSNDLTEFAVLRADALKYIVTFRNQLPLEDVIIPSLPLIIHHLNASSVVVHTYAANAIEKLFTLRDPSNTALPSIKITHCQTIVDPLLRGLFGVFTKEGSSENEYAMKAIMKSLSLFQQNILPYLPEIIQNLTLKLTQVSKNPSKPHFNHYLFESICLSIKIACQNDKSSVSSFETLLFPLFQEILISDVQEFMPYVFQILSMLLEVHEQQIPDPYMQLFPFLLAPVLWERMANIAPLVRLLQAYVEKGSAQIVAAAKLEGLLGVFQKLISSKTNDHYGFYLLQSIVEFVNSESLSLYLKQIFNLLFHRLTLSKTVKYVKSLLVFFCFFINKYGPTVLVSLVDSLQPKMFGLVIEKLFLVDIQKVSGPIERKICAIGITKILCDTDLTIVGEYSEYWGKLLQALVSLFELPEDDTVPDDEHFIEIEDTPGYHASYAQLVFGSKKERDPNHNIPDAKVYLAQSLAKLSQKYPGKINAEIAATLVPEVVSHLQNYCRVANVNIV